MSSRTLLSYLKQQLPHFITAPSYPKYLFLYNVIKIKRFLLQTSIVFIFQYLTQVHLTTTLPSLPMNPSMGLAFSFFYLIGKSALPGLLLGELAAYLLRGFTFGPILLYLIADIGLGCLAGFLCSTILSSDIRPFVNPKENGRFLKTTAKICLLSGAVRVLADYWVPHEAHFSVSYIIFNFIDHFFSDLNGILVLGAFLISWVAIPFTQEKIFRGSLDKIPAVFITLLIVFTILFINQSSLHLMVIASLIGIYLLFVYGNKNLLFKGRFKKSPFIVFLIFILFSLLFMNPLELAYFTLVLMSVSLYIAYVYGYLIATASTFLLASLFMADFAELKYAMLNQFGLATYTLVPIFLFIYIIAMILIGHANQSLSDVFPRPKQHK